MRHFLLVYETSEDFVQRRGAFRRIHLEHAWAAAERGELVLGGALGEPTGAADGAPLPAHGALLLFQGESREAAELFARSDPYVTEGLVRSWEVREWTTVVGESAASAVRP